MTTDNDTKEFPDCCGEDAANGYESHLCDYVNDDCPDRCSTVHAEPEQPTRPILRGAWIEAWTCPYSGARYSWCGLCDAWEYDAYGDGSTAIDGEWVPDPGAHDYYSCDVCDRWLHSDEANHNDWGTFCDGCWRNNRPGSDRTPAVRLVTCPACQTPNDRYEPRTERFVCACHGKPVAA